MHSTLSSEPRFESLQDARQEGGNGDKKSVAVVFAGLRVHLIGVSFDRETRLGHPRRTCDIGCLEDRSICTAMGNPYFFPHV